MQRMDNFNFPPLRIGLLQGLLGVKERVDADADALEGAPYDNETKSLLQRLFAPKVVEKRVEVPVDREPEKAGRGRPSNDVALSAEDQDKLKSEIDSLMEELNQLGKGKDDDTVTLDTGERIKIIQVKSRLLDQLLKMQERIFNVKRNSEFQTVVIGILDDLVSEDDREVFLKRINPYRS